MIPASFTVDVRHEEIELGQRHECQRCPLALALTREYPDARWWVTEARVFDLVIGGRVRRWKHDSEDWIHQYDLGKSVKPVTVTLTEVRA